jgi:hypothetical protein
VGFDCLGQTQRVDPVDAVDDDLVGRPLDGGGKVGNALDLSPTDGLTRQVATGIDLVSEGVAPDAVRGIAGELPGGQSIALEIAGDLAVHVEVAVDRDIRLEGEDGSGRLAYCLAGGGVGDDRDLQRGNWSNRHRGIVAGIVKVPGGTTDHIRPLPDECRAVVGADLPVGRVRHAIT